MILCEPCSTRANENASCAFILSSARSIKVHEDLFGLVLRLCHKIGHPHLEWCAVVTSWCCESRPKTWSGSETIFIVYWCEVAVEE